MSMRLTSDNQNESAAANAAIFQPPGVPGERSAARPDGAPDAPPPAAVTTGHAQDRKRRGESDQSGS